MEIAKVAAAGIVTAMLYALIRQIKPEIAPLVVLGGVSVIVLMIARRFVGVTDTVNDMLELSGIGKENTEILIKSAIICVVSRFAADICYDNSCSSIGSAVELAGRVGAIVLAMPMIQSVALAAIGLME